MKRQIDTKYRIKERLELLTHEEYTSALKSLPKALNISPRTFLRYLYTRIDDDYSMPADHLARLAKFFNCRIEDMLDYDPPPLSFKEIRKKDKSILVKKFRLVK
jgi:hypothetical protein